MRFRPTLPSPSMTVALTALFVALGGTGYAASQLPGARGEVAKKKKPTACLSALRLCSNLKAAVDSEIARADDSGKDLAGLNALLAVTPVPNATHASSADRATTAGSANSATTAGGAPPTGAAGGALSGSYPNPSFAPLPAATPIAVWGQTSSDYKEPGNPAGYYKDPLGIVHLTGAIAYGGGYEAVFNLPVGYRSAAFFAASSGSGSVCKLTMDLTGNVYTANACASPIGLDGITFRALG